MLNLLQRWLCGVGEAVPTALIGAGAGVLAGVVTLVEVAVVVHPGAEVALGVSGISQLAVPSSALLVWPERSSRSPSNPNLLFAFKTGITTSSVSHTYDVLY